LSPKSNKNKIYKQYYFLFLAFYLHKVQAIASLLNVGQKLKFWSEVEILVKNRNFGQKLKFWSKIEILVRN